MGTIYTHRDVDLDAAASVWFAQKIMGMKDAELAFVPANWDGAEMKDVDLALDIPAGGSGIKGIRHEGGTVGSCFAWLVAHLANDEDQEALRHLVAFVDAQDAHGSAAEWLAPEASPEAHAVLGATGINGVLRAYQAAYPGDDAFVVKRMAEIFSGMLEIGRAHKRAEIEADAAELIGGGLVAIVRNKDERATNGVLFGRGVRIVIYVDGFNVGMIREGSETLRMDDPALRAVVEAAGEEVGHGADQWFAHTAGFLFAWGTYKAPATKPSRVRPEDLAAAAARLLSTSSTEH